MSTCLEAPCEPAETNEHVSEESGHFHPRAPLKKMCGISPSTEHLSEPMATMVRIPKALAHRRMDPRLFGFPGFSSKRYSLFCNPIGGSTASWDAIDRTQNWALRQRRGSFSSNNEVFLEAKICRNRRTEFRIKTEQNTRRSSKRTKWRKVKNHGSMSYGKKICYRKCPWIP